ncbi:MAG: hypothetical protein LBQ93_06800 [Treponema sp.]|jgi:hypothetical protein|nr:hypothetical protein [Treponema sp.]
MTNILPVFIVIAIALVIVFTELIKKLDCKNILKGYRVYIPAVLSCGIACLLRLGDFFQPQQVWFWWAVIFGFSVFAYEAILKKITTALGDNGASS